MKLSCFRYKQKFDLSPADFNRVIGDLKSDLQVREAGQDRAESERHETTASSDTAGAAPVPQDEAEIPPNEADILPDETEIDRLFDDPEKNPKQTLTDMLSESRYERQNIEQIQMKVESRIRARAQARGLDEKAQNELSTVVAKISKKRGSKGASISTDLLAELANQEPSAVPDIVTRVLLPALSGDQNGTASEEIRSINENIFLPALEGRDVDPSAAGAYGADAEDLRIIEAILRNIRKAWQQEAKAEIKNEASRGKRTKSGKTAAEPLVQVPAEIRTAL